MDSSRVKVTKNGQVSIPAVIRRRWQVDEVLVIDEGEYAILRPLPADPIAAVRGIFKSDSGPDSAELRAIAREEEHESEQRRLNR